MTMEQTDRMEHDKNCRNRESGVSEIIGAVLLIALVVTAIAIVGVGMLSQPLPEKIPAVDAIISTSGRDIQITHNGGDTLQKDEMVILVDGQDQTANFLKVGCSSWQSLSPGESLTVSYPNKPDNVRIVYKGAGASSVVSSAIFGEAGQPIAPYTIMASTGGGGTINPLGAIPVFFREDKPFTITPATGYQVADVLVDGSSVGNVTTYTFMKVVASHTISAMFASDTFTITASTGPNGNVTPAGVTTLSYGGSQTYTITPITGYHVADVLVDGSSVGNVTTYPFTSVSASHTISATFAINQYTITATSGADGTVTPAGVTTVSYGGSQAYTIAATTAGYHIANVLADGVSNGTISSYTFTNVQANHTISATFAINQYTITATSGADGTVTPAGVTTVSYGGSQAYTIAATTAGYHIANVLVDGVSNGTISSYTFTNVQANHTISATFAINQYTITATAGTGGTINPTGAVSVNYDANQTFNIVPTTNYHIADVTVDSSSVGAVSTYNFANVTANHTISATFTGDAPTLTSISPSSGIRASGTSVIITGTNLVGATSVTFGSNAATINNNTATKIGMTAPAGTGTVTVTVTTPNGTATTSYNYFIIRIFTASGTWTAPSSVTVEYLVVGGGGGGGGFSGAGGGAGAVWTGTLTAQTGTKTVTIGPGGAGSTNNRGTTGTSSVFATITATGGGGGASSANTAGRNGGSGGGAVGTGAVGTGVAGHGFAGGAGKTWSSGGNQYLGGGGGGASVVGGAATGPVGTVYTAGSGGAGTDYSGTFGTGFGESGFVAGGGGGGGSSVGGSTFGTGGNGGGGDGSVTGAGTAGLANTGGGGGGGAAASGGGAGGSGLVVIKYY